MWLKFRALVVLHQAILSPIGMLPLSIAGVIVVDDWATLRTTSLQHQHCQTLMFAALKPFTQPFQSVNRTISYNRKVFFLALVCHGHDAISLLVTSTASKQEVSGSSPKMWVWRNRSRKQLSQCKYLLGWIKHCAALLQSTNMANITNSPTAEAVRTFLQGS